MSKCVRCNAKLPPDSGFCAACGHNNPAAAIEKKFGMDKEINKRLRRANLFRRIANIIFRIGK